MGTWEIFDIFFLFNCLYVIAEVILSDSFKLYPILSLKISMFFFSALLNEQKLQILCSKKKKKKRGSTA